LQHIDIKGIENSRRTVIFWFVSHDGRYFTLYLL